MIFFQFWIFRKVSVDDGHELSLQYSCLFYEVSAAESFAGVSLAFQSVLREARSVQLLKTLPIRRKLGVNSVSKVKNLMTFLPTTINLKLILMSSKQVLGNIFGKNSSKDRKKRPSLSIWEIAAVCVIKFSKVNICIL